MSDPARRPWTVDEFLAWERGLDERYEYVDHMIRMMVGGSNDHNTIIGNFHTLLGRAVLGDGRLSGCRVASQGAKIVAQGNVMYPDVLLACGPQDPKSDVMEGPRLIVEVLSASSAGFDRGPKWVAYRSIATLEDYCLVSQDAAGIEHYRRAADGWTLLLVSGLDAALKLASVDAPLGLADTYRSTSVAGA